MLFIFIIINFLSHKQVHPVDLFTYTPSTASVQYTISPIAGEEIATLCAFVILGGRKPLVVLVKSSKDVEFGDVVPMPTELLSNKVKTYKSSVVTLSIRADFNLMSNLVFGP